VLTTLIFLYTTTGVISLVAYLPTMRDLWRGKSTAILYTYALWTGCSVITLLYGVFVLQDFLYDVITGIQFLACGITLILRIGLPK